MSDKFEISVDSQNRLLHIRVWGFWSLEEALSYQNSMMSAMGSLENDPWNVIADVRMFPVQPSPVQKVHCKLMQHAIQMGMVRSANIVGGRLTRVQMERLSASAWPEKGHFGFFPNETDAMEWLRKE